MSKKEFEFEILVNTESCDRYHVLDALYEGGCDDTIMGLGRPGFIAISFLREGDDEESVKSLAMKQVTSALPTGAFIQDKIDSIKEVR